MKSLLISLMAFLCALGVYAAPTGTGTEEEAHPINSGEEKILSLHHGKFNVRVFGKLHAAIQYIISFYNSKSRK